MLTQKVFFIVTQLCDAHLCKVWTIVQSYSSVLGIRVPHHNDGRIIDNKQRDNIRIDSLQIDNLQ